MPQDQCSLIVRKLDFERRSDLENQARIKRFEAFQQILKLYRFDKIALGHQKNDQAETILMNIFRGSGINGMSGIKPRFGSTIHPMLCFSAGEIQKILHLAELEARQDSSNQLLVHNRNRIRKDFIPMIEERFNPAFIEKMSAQAAIFRKTEEYLCAKIPALLKRISIEHLPEGEVIGIPQLLRLPETEQFYCLRALYSTFSKTETDFFMHTYNEIRRFCQSPGSSAKLLSHNVLLKKQYDELIICNADSEAQEEKAEAIQIDEDRSRAVYLNYRFAFKFSRFCPGMRMKFMATTPLSLMPIRSGSPSKSAPVFRETVLFLWNAAS